MMTTPERKREIQRAYYHRNREARLAKVREYRAVNAERIAAEKRRKYAENPDIYKARSREWAIANAESVRRRKAKYHAEHRAEAQVAGAAWLRLHPEAAQERDARRRSRKRNATTFRLRTSDLAARWDYYGGKCWMCGVEAVEWDHVKPLSKGGAHMLANLRPACRSCNATKSNKWVVAA